MTSKQAYQHLYNTLCTVYEAREAGNITSIVFEDEFSGPQFLAEWSEEDQHRLNRVGERLKKMEPWQYVLGQADFYGLKFRSDARALIPRPETEELVHQIIKDLRKINHDGNGIRLLDVGTGTGCIPLTLKHHLRNMEAHAVDVSAEALSLTQENAKDLGLDIHLYAMDVLDRKKWTSLPEFQVVVSNPPYIPTKERTIMSDNVLRYEPDLALFVPDAEPLLFYEAIAELAWAKLSTNGYLYFEIHEDYAKETVALLKKNGFQQISVLEDLQGKDRMIRARKP